MKKFLISSVISYSAILLYLYFIFIPLTEILGRIIDPQTLSELGIYGLCFFGVPPTIGYFSYVAISWRIGNPFRHAVLLFPYYYILYYLCFYMGTYLATMLLETDKISLLSLETIPFFLIHYFLMTTMLYVYTPRKS